jgi:hypothetical protein
LTLVAAVMAAGAWIPAAPVAAITWIASAGRLQTRAVQELPEPLTLASISLGGSGGNGESRYPSISGDGLSVTFQSDANNLSPVDRDTTTDVFVKDISTGVVTVASTSDSGIKGNDLSRFPSMSTDASTVAFQSFATNLDPADVDSSDDVFVKDLSTGDIVLASTSDTGAKGNNASFQPALDGDGDRVAFTSQATNFDPADTDILYDIYRKDLSTGDIVLASVTKAGVKGNDASLLPALSDAGGRVAFISRATNLHPADTDSLSHVYVKQFSNGKMFLASASDTGVKGNGGSYDVSISDDGTTVVFDSEATNLDPADTGAGADLYVKDLATGDVTLASTSDDGVKGNGISFGPTSISADGTMVAFQSSATNLDPDDTDIQADLYVKNLVTGDIELVSTSTDGEKADAVTDYPELSADGGHVAFHSDATNLDRHDVRTVGDIFVKEPIVCTAEGTDSDDVLTGTDVRDVICAGDGDDTLEGLGGGDVLLGEGGVDTLSYAQSPAGVTVDLANADVDGGDAAGDVFEGIESLTGSSFPDSLFGDAGPNELRGRGAADVLGGAEGDDDLLGAGGDDLLAGGPGADALDGRGGVDMATYSESPGAVVANLASGVGSGSNAEGDTFAGIEGLGGTPFDDTLTGDVAPNTLIGQDGGDLLTGGGGADVIDGSAGIDLAAYDLSPAGVTVDLAAQTVGGGDATGDTIASIEGAVGSSFADSLVGGAATDVLMGLAGADTLDGAGGTDVVLYTRSPLGVVVNLSTGAAAGGHAAGDVILGVESVTGSSLGDTLTGTAGVNTLSGLGGDDTLNGLGSDDVLIGGSGTDTFSGGGGTDTCDDVAGEAAASCEV